MPARMLTLAPALAALVLFAAPKEPYVERVFDPAGLDVATLKSLADRGSIVIVDNDEKGRPELVTAGTVVDATPETVYGVITDYDKFPEFMPQVESCKIVKQRDDGTRDVEFGIKVKVSVVTQRVKYTARFHKYVPNEKVAFEFVDGDIKDGGGSYVLVPYDGGKKTLMFYSTVSDIKSAGYFTRKIVEDQPSMEGAMLVSTAQVVSGAVKKRAEKLELKKAQVSGVR